jgi:hypothetical protein
MVTVIATKNEYDSVKVAIACCADFKVVLKSAAIASSCKLTNRLARIFKTDRLIHQKFAVWISLVTATFNISILTELGAVVFKTYVACFFQMGALT